mmetsp:Transcript_18725/g.33406  ORF Transcript_18725/g.33406 Transcript_18725/m.33406 type:complete len:401 (-) Transcript_18725:650-1852(-)
MQDCSGWRCELGEVGSVDVAAGDVVDCALDVGRREAVDVDDGVHFGELGEEGLEMRDGVRHVVDAHHFSDGVHRQLRGAHVDGADAHAGGQDGADGGAARQVAANRKLLHGDAVSLAKFAKEAGADGVGGVALVLVVLDDDALVEQGLVLRVVLVHVVGVQRVCHVSRHQKAALQRAHHHPLLLLPQHSRHALDCVQHDGPTGALRAGGADLLVVEEGHRAHAHLLRQRLFARRVEQRGERTVAHRQVVQPPHPHKLVVHAADDARLGVAHVELQVEDVLGVATQLFCQHIEQRATVVVLPLVTLRIQSILDAGGKHRAEVVLRVDVEAVRHDLAVQMDRQHGDAHQRPVHLHQAVRYGAVRLPNQHAARNGEVAVKPGGPQPSAVRLHVHHCVLRLVIL